MTLRDSFHGAAVLTPPKKAEELSPAEKVRRLLDKDHWFMRPYGTLRAQVLHQAADYIERVGASNGPIGPNRSVCILNAVAIAHTKITGKEISWQDAGHHYFEGRSLATANDRINDSRVRTKWAARTLREAA